MLLLLLLLRNRREGIEGQVERVRLLPGVRLVERPGVLHFFDGHRVVSVRGDEGGRRALRAVIGAMPSAADHPADTGAGTAGGVSSRAAEDARELLTRLNLVDPAGPAGPADAIPAGAGEAHSEAHSEAPSEAPIAAPIDAHALSVGADFASAATAGWVGPQLARERLQAVRVHVWDDCGALGDALSAAGLRCEPLSGPEQIAALEPARSMVVIAATEQQPLARLRAANTACLQHGVSWLPVGGFDGASVHVGPLMIPGQTACAECLLRRLAANVEYAGVFHEVAGAPSAPTPRALREWANSVATLILLRWLAGRDAALPGLLLTLAPGELAMRQARVYRVPRCPSCAGPDFVTAPAPWDIARDH